MDEYPILEIKFTIPEIVKLISCCNQAIVNSEETLREYGNIRMTAHSFTLQDSIDKIWSIKTKIQKSIFDQFGKLQGENIPVSLSILEFIKLNACCNSAIEFQEKTLRYITTDSIVKSTNESICQIRDIKYKIKQELNSLYGRLCVENSKMIIIDTIPEEIRED